MLFDTKRVLKTTCFCPPTQHNKTGAKQLEIVCVNHLKLQHSLAIAELDIVDPTPTLDVLSAAVITELYIMCAISVDGKRDPKYQCPIHCTGPQLLIAQLDEGAQT